FALTVFSQPPLFNSDWQFPHHGAQRWTTLRPGALIASVSCCSAGDAAKSEATRDSVRMTASFFTGTRIAEHERCLKASGRVVAGIGDPGRAKTRRLGRDHRSRLQVDHRLIRAIIRPPFL